MSSLRAICKDIALLPLARALDFSLLAALSERTAVATRSLYLKSYQYGFTTLTNRKDVNKYCMTQPFNLCKRPGREIYTPHPVARGEPQSANLKPSQISHGSIY